MGGGIVGTRESAGEGFFKEELDGVFQNEVIRAG